MPTMTTPDAPPLPTVTIDAADPKAALASEWLLTNGLGGFAMGTPAAVNTRRYHALLVASLNPPVDRVVALSAVADTVTLQPGSPEEHAVTLTPFHFGGNTDRPTAAPAPCRFERTPVECRWTYTIDSPAGPCTVTRTLRLFDGRNAAAINYRVESPVPVRLALRPLTGLRDFHELTTGDDIAASYQARPVEDGVLCATRHAGVHLTCTTADGHAADYRNEPDIWHGVRYERDEARDQPHTEDLFSPGLFVLDHHEPGTLDATLHASIDAMPPAPLGWDRSEKASRIAARIAHVEERAASPDEDGLDPAITDALARLTAAADDFVVQRGHTTDNATSVIAGYPWFADWGRDTMIALPGLLLATGRHDEALNTLAVFADARQHGLIPNRFDDRTNAADTSPAHFNTVDASLWFLHAAAEYRRITGDHDGYMDRLAQACADIIDAYRVGTIHDIRLDTDGLITAGNPATQLTWMDAQRDGVTFTPRHGKAVEINALWHRGLLATADAIETEYPRRAGEHRELAAQSADAIRTRFVRDDGLGLYDRIEPTTNADGSTAWAPCSEIRPNQIFAVSLPGSPLTTDQQAATLAVVKDRLLTPHGLRTLDPADPAYVGRYEGTMFERDAAYHNGTAWPWLLGPYAEAVLRVGNFSSDAKADAIACLTPLIDVLGSTGVGQLAEVYDGDNTPGRPQHPDGCPAQAWSVAEPLRILTLLNARSSA